MKKGLLMIFTGDGKGKTTAALGMTLRAAGHGMKVCFIQFIKGSWKYGELDAVKRFEDVIDFHVMGKGFTWKSDDLEEDRRLAREAWDFARKAMESGEYGMVVLDEFTYLLNFGMIEPESVTLALSNRPPDLHVVITGRNAAPALVEAADLVTEMGAVKHPLKAGIKAQKGVEF
jgi:cob(I)alamin adenosyltransferase